jgi:hypothetical protein
MIHRDDITLETFDNLAAWDEDDRDLIETTALVYDVDGMPVGYDATPLLGLEVGYVRGRF